MVLNRADFGKSKESFQTPWKNSSILADGFPTTFRIVREDIGWMPKDRKSIDFDKKSPWLWTVPIWVSARKPSKLLICLLCSSKWLSNYFRDYSWRFGVNFEGSEIHRFWPKTLGYSPWFWTGSIWVSAGKCSKLPEMRPICFQMDFQLLSGLFLKIWGEFRRVRNPPILTKNPGQ